jgi:hypothetical protein
MNARSSASPSGQAGRLEHLQVLRDGGAAHREVVGNPARGQLHGADQPQNFPPTRFRQRLEDALHL